MDTIKKFLKGVWTICSYLFWPQINYRKKQEEKGW